MSSRIVAVEKFPPATWLLRIAPVFAEWGPEIIEALGCETVRPMAKEYTLVRVPGPDAMRGCEAWKYVGWNLRVDHAWPCNPAKMEGFIEKAARGLAARFGSEKPQRIAVGALDAGNPYFKQLASNLRGRALQLFPEYPPAEDADGPVLFCMVGKEGLFCGLQSAIASNGVYPGGTKYIATGGPDSISRAGAKIAGALHYLEMHQTPLPEGSRWLELGASPGGMTAELLRCHFRVTAIDRAPLDGRLANDPALIFLQAGVAEYTPSPNTRFEAILCDMNGDALASLRQVVRLSRFLTDPGLVVFTLKTPGAASLDEMDELYRQAVRLAADQGLRLIAGTHLPYNRQEFTLFFRSGMADRGNPLA